MIHFLHSNKFYFSHFLRLIVCLKVLVMLGIMYLWRGIMTGWVSSWQWSRVVCDSLVSNQRPVFRSREFYWPIAAQCGLARASWGHEDRGQWQCTMGNFPPPSRLFTHLNITSFEEIFGLYPLWLDCKAVLTLSDSLKMFKKGLSREHPAGIHLSFYCAVVRSS